MCASFFRTFSSNPKSCSVCASSRWGKVGQWSSGPVIVSLHTTNPPQAQQH